VQDQQPPLIAEDEGAADGPRHLPVFALDLLH